MASHPPGRSPRSEPAELPGAFSWVVFRSSPAGCPTATWRSSCRPSRRLLLVAVVALPHRRTAPLLWDLVDCHRPGVPRRRRTRRRRRRRTLLGPRVPRAVSAAVRCAAPWAAMSAARTPPRATPSRCYRGRPLAFRRRPRRPSTTWLRCIVPHSSATSSCEVSRSPLRRRSARMRFNSHGNICITGRTKTMNIAEPVTTASGGPGSRGKCPPPPFFLYRTMLLFVPK